VYVPFQSDEEEKRQIRKTIDECSPKHPKRRRKSEHLNAASLKKQF